MNNEKGDIAVVAKRDENHAFDSTAQSGRLLSKADQFEERTVTGFIQCLVFPSIFTGYCLLFCVRACS